MIRYTNPRLFYFTFVAYVTLRYVTLLYFCSYRHKTCSINNQWLWDYVIKFARWQHPTAWRWARFACARNHLFFMVLVLFELTEINRRSLQTNAIRRTSVMKQELSYRKQIARQLRT